ncbi:zinc carboxypeptidase [Blastomyces gilchristii SLH14081]|uniref:Inactive metallocarboxypeptidase ECM14 n=1 Tax=Blastomyces gilchristii (strain SLH14081) TaxID=559298 RepID=ECM14_BLAGS|nr:zinc carboxypeptidase [Blastomyces gilchristii SLH14081]C5JZS0.1 RecName: Full=Inactive metallocarboxypeptidase ECM14; Flags: Precursor [Blastomyces gilchristii SLH14081]OAT12751.1 zinc carboxypeptidase [Blastomyces gilchristii SLH14081]
MRQFTHGTLLAILALANTISAIPSFSANNYPAHPAEPLALFAQSQPQAPLGLWTRLRNSVIERLWGVPPQQRNHRGGNKQYPFYSAPASLQARYSDDVVLRFRLQTADEVKALVEASNILFLDVWASTDEWVDIRLAKDVVPSLLGLLPKSLQTAHVPLIHDLPQTVYESYPSSSQRPTDNGRGFLPSRESSSDVTNIFFEDYQPLSVIGPWMRLLASMFPSHVQLISIGSSFEGRDIPALRVGVRPANDPKPRKTVIIGGGSHAREWIGVSTVNYVAYSLITTYGKSTPISTLLEQFDFIFIPTINPDGYVHTWETDRLWRKNRQETSLPFCPGVDLDRTWGFEWNGNATGDNPCSESYGGDEPFAGTEARQLAGWVKEQTEQHNVKFIAYLDLHSYSQQVLYPYSYSCLPRPPNLENLEELAMGIAKAIRLTNRQSYTVSSACQGFTASQKKVKLDTFPRMESAGGSALDWFYNDVGVKYSYQLKLRDKGSYGFLLPRENIVPTGKEVFNAVMVLGKFLLGSDGFEGLNWEAEFQRLNEADKPILDDGDDDEEEDGQDKNDDSWIPDEYKNDNDHDDDDDGWGLRRRRKR